VELQAYLAERIPLVDRQIDAALPSADEEPASLHGAMRHLLFPGGKRLRPAFAMAAAEAIGAPAEVALPAAVAVELVHTYSLIHDDLPCMDDDALRRGKPTVHVAYDEAVAVLAGDALLAAAFEVLAGAAKQAGAERAALAVGDVARAAGSRALVGGQVDDLSPTAQHDSAEGVESVHRRKSAALIAASIVAGARLGGADDALLERLERFGLEVGVAFQIADDVLDEDEEDACSLVRVLGRGGARARAEQLLEGALNQIAELGERAEPLRELARHAVRRDQ